MTSLLTAIEQTVDRLPDTLKRWDDLSPAARAVNAELIASVLFDFEDAVEAREPATFEVSERLLHVRQRLMPLLATLRSRVGIDIDLRPARDITLSVYTCSEDPETLYGIAA